MANASTLLALHGEVSLSFRRLTALSRRLVDRLGGNRGADEAGEQEYGED